MHVFAAALIAAVVSVPGDLVTMQCDASKRVVLSCNYWCHQQAQQAPGFDPSDAYLGLMICLACWTASLSDLPWIVQIEIKAFCPLPFGSGRASPLDTSALHQEF